MPASAAGQAGRHERHRERDGVGQHVAGVRQQRQRGGQHARHDLHHHEGEDQGQRQNQRAQIGVAVYVCVPVRV